MESSHVEHGTRTARAPTTLPGRNFALLPRGYGDPPAGRLCKPAAPLGDSSDPDGDAGVVEDEAEPVVDESGPEVERRCDIVVAGPLLVVVEPCIALFQSFHTEGWRAHVCGGGLGAVAYVGAQPRHRERIRTGCCPGIHTQRNPGLPPRGA